MIRKDSFVPQARLAKPLGASRLTLVSSCGVHLKTDQPLDVCHPFGDFRFLRVPSRAKHDDLIIHQLKYPHDDADLDINVILWSRGVARWFRRSLSVTDPFVSRCLTSSALLPFPHPAHRTGRADLPHPALGEDSHNRRGHCM
jgi:hypothetical protein